VSRAGKASVRPLERPLGRPGAAARAGTRGAAAAVAEQTLRERRLAAQNLRRALPQVRRHQGAPGGDGRSVDDLGEDGKTPGPRRRAACLEGP
jgi:hypothetical protein